MPRTQINESMVRRVAEAWAESMGGKVRLFHAENTRAGVQTLTALFFAEQECYRVTATIDLGNTAYTNQPIVESAKYAFERVTSIPVEYANWMVKATVAANAPVAASDYPAETSR